MEQSVERNGEVISDVLVETGGKQPSALFTELCAKLDKWVRTLELTYDGHELSLDVASNVNYDPTQLSAAMMDQPMKVAWWGSLAARLSRMQTEAKVELERAKAAVAQMVRDGSIATPSGKITEGAIAEVATLHTSVIAAQERLAHVTEKLEIVKTVCEALRHRRDMIHLDGLLQNTELKSINMGVRG